MASVKQIIVCVSYPWY